MRYALLAPVLITLSASPALPQSQQDKSVLARFPASEPYQGPSKFPDFRGRDRAYNLYRTRIREGMSNGANFASIYSLISFGCGTGCSQVYIVNNINGKVSDVPIGGEDTPYLQLYYNINSSALIAYWQVNGRCVRKLLAVSDAGFREYRQSDIGPEDACYSIEVVDRAANTSTTSQRLPDQQDRALNTTDEKSFNAAQAKADQEASLNQQAAFIAAIKYARTVYSQGQNDMAKGASRPERAKNVCAALKGYYIKNWVGKISKLSSNSEGKGVLHVEISPQVYLKTWSNSFSDIADATLIDAASKVFKQASVLQEGRDIQFSGNFAPSSADCAKESSLTLPGSIERPEYIFRFSDVSPL